MFVRAACEHVFVEEPGDSPKRKVGRPRSAHAVNVIRECFRHGPTDFGRYGAGGGRYRYKCKRCVADAVTKRHRKIRAMLIAEAGGRCAVCGYSRCKLNLHFHHVDPREKLFEMTMARGKSEAAYRAEMRKCALVCANCHGEIEAGLIDSPPSIGELLAPRALVDRRGRQEEEPVLEQRDQDDHRGAHDEVER
jgi:hypothetical protein